MTTEFYAITPGNGADSLGPFTTETEALLAVGAVAMALGYSASHWTITPSERPA